MNDNIIRKAHNVGDRNPKNPNFIWTEYKPGKFDWRPEKKNKTTTVNQNPSAKNTVKKQTVTNDNKSVAKKDIKNMNPNELVDYANSASTESLTKVVNDTKLNKDIRQIAFNVLKTRDDYDKKKVNSADLTGGYIPKPTPKIQYQTKKPEVEINLPDSWTIRVTGKNGQLENKQSSLSGLRKLYASKSDNDLLNILNNPNGRWQNRQIAYEEAAARGIDESKIDVSGKLQKEWDSQKRKHDLEESLKGNFNEEEADAVNVDFKGFDHESFMKDFLESGDTGWMNEKDPRVVKAFNGFKTLTSRQQYDALKTYYEPTMPGYLNPDNKIGLLNEQYDNFIKYKTTPLFISAGGAGIGKTFGWRNVAEDNNLPELQSDDDVNNADWGWVMLSDPEDDKDFRETLAKYNGTYKDDNGEDKPHILVFDDADKILTSNAVAIKALMKKITDGNPKNRIFVNPSTGKNEVFKGAILIMTNKDISALSNASEDAKAIMSRGFATDIHFTRAETMDLINKRYKYMDFGDFQSSFEKQFPNKKDQLEVRQKVRDWIEEHLDEADPAKFTVRTFIDIIRLAAPSIAKGSNGKVRTINGNIQIGTNIPWEVQALSLIKAETNDIEKSENDEFNIESMIDKKKSLLKHKKDAKKNDKKKYNNLYGQKAIDAYLFGKDYSESKEDNKEKALESDFGMSLDEAEKILLS
jgi:hypothetical protein